MRLTDLFFVVVYLSVIGGLFGVASLFVSHIFGRVRGLWLPLCGMALYLLPVLSPEVCCSPRSRNSAWTASSLPGGCGPRDACFFSPID